MRWVWLLVAMLAFAALFQVTEAWMVAVALLVAGVAIVAAFFSFAAARVGAVSNNQSSRELDVLIAAQQRSAARAAEPRPGHAAEPAPAPAPAKRD